MCKSTENTGSSLRSLIRQAQNGSQQAFDDLLRQYSPLIKSLTARFSDSMSAQDREDFQQEATVLFCRALMNYDAEQTGVEFGLYAKICISNGLISQLRALKHRGTVLSLPEEDSLLSSQERDDPARHLVEQENYRLLYRRIESSLSDYENRVWWLYCSGQTAKEIACSLCKDEKSVQNAVCRIRKKLRSVVPHP